MKIHSLTMALYLSIATMTAASTATALSMHQRCDAPNREKTILGLSKDLLNIFTSQNIVFAYEGALALSNSTTDTMYLTALIGAETDHLNTVTELFVHKLLALGVNASQISTFKTLSAQMYVLGWIYAELVRTNAKLRFQQRAANAWGIQAQEVGAVLAQIAHDPSIVEDYANIVITQTQNVQAFTGVLEGGLVSPSNQATEALAAVELNENIVKLGNAIAAKTVKGFCHR